MTNTLTVKAGDKVHLDKLDPADHQGLDKSEAEARTSKLGAELTELQELLYAAGQHGLLIVLQGRDTAGKDGTVRCLLNFMNAQGTSIAPFKVPTPKELAHDFLWRAHAVTPGRGESVIFNRSHYEDVLVVRVHSLAPQPVWSKHYDHINDFERLLTDSNVIVLKFMLNISKEESKQRLLEREQDTEKSWKLSVNDWKERELWDEYTDAYEDALEKCATDAAPWHVVAADHKWFRNLAITEKIVETLRPYRDGWMKHLAEVGAKAEAELTAYRATLTP